MVEADIGLAPFLMVGVRAGYLHCMPASVHYNYVLYDQTTTLNASLIPLEAGLSVVFEVPATSLSLMAGVFGGYNFARASYKSEIIASNQTETITLPYTGGGFIGELIATINLKMNSLLSLNVNGGYRFAKIPQMVQAKDISYNGIPGISILVGEKGDILKDSENEDLMFDFSGFLVGVGFSVGF
jgi:hypothetical protein